MQIKLLLDENHWFPGYYHFHWKPGLRADFVHLFYFNASTVPYTTLFYSVLSYHGIYYIHYTTSALYCSILTVIPNTVPGMQYVLNIQILFYLFDSVPTSSKWKYLFVSRKCEHCLIREALFKKITKYCLEMISHYYCCNNNNNNNKTQITQLSSARVLSS